jgi:uncharacterized repeat protein (TIGR04076 family)
LPTCCACIDEAFKIQLFGTIHKNGVYSVVVDENLWKLMQTHLGYDDKEMEEFRGNPRNIDVLAKASELINKTIVAEVVESKNCNSQHKVGDRFIFDGAGNLLTKKSPKRICIYALAELPKFIFAINELVYAGADPKKIRFKRTGCFDVGVACGGWGHITIEIKVEERQK